MLTGPGQGNRLAEQTRRTLRRNVNSFVSSGGTSMVAANRSLMKLVARLAARSELEAMSLRGRLMASRSPAAVGAASAGKPQPPRPPR